MNKCFIIVGKCLAIFLVAPFLSQPCRAGMQTSTGREWKFWTASGHSVIVARVKEVSVAKGDAGNDGIYVATLEPVALLAGTLDPSEHPELHVAIYVGDAGSGTMIRTPPKAAATVVAVMQGNNFIISDVCTFMPGGSALVEVTGLGDPKIVNILKSLQDARAHADPDPHFVRPATRPAVPASNTK